LELPAFPFTPPWLIGGHLLSWVLVCHALLHAHWHRLHDRESLNIYLACCVGVLVLWQIQAQLPSGPHLHLLGATLMTLMFGWRFALIAITLIASLSLLTGHMEGASLGLNLLVNGVLPISISWLSVRVVVRWLARNYFVYIFVACFGGAALAIASSGLAGWLLLEVASSTDTRQLMNLYTDSCLLLLFPEAFVTGMLLTLFTIYAPQWVTTFRDERYIHGR